MRPYLLCLVPLLILTACDSRDSTNVTFQEPPPEPVSISVERIGDGAGSVRSEPPGTIDCGAQCSADFDATTTLALVAEPATDNRFSGWGGACSGTAQCMLTLSGPTTVTARFEPISQPALHVTKPGLNGRGTVTSTPEGLRCDTDCSEASAEFEDGTSVTLTAAAATGHYFAGWSGDCEGETCSLSMTADRNVAATFLPDAPQGAWYGGDGHVHNDHSSDGSFLRQGLDDRGPGTTSIADQIGFAVLQQLDWMPLTDHRTFDQHYDPLWDSDQLLLITGEEANGSPHCTVFGHIDTAVQGAGPAGDPGFRTVQQSLWDIRAQGALWNQAHPDRRSYDQANDTANAFGSQVGQALAEVWNRGENPEAEIDYAENRWNAGWRFGVVGASDNHDKLLWAISGPGSPTTYVFAADDSERAILQGLAAGRTTVSSGPLGPFLTLEADVDGDGRFEGVVGDELLAEPGTRFQLRIGAERALGLDVRLYAAPGRDNGPDNPLEPLATLSGTELATGAITLDVTAPNAGHGWWYLMVRGPGVISGLGAPANPSDQLLAMTTPIFVSVTGERAEPQPEIPVPVDSALSDNAKPAFSGADFHGFADVAVAGSAVHLVAEQHQPAATTVVYRRGSTGRDTLTDPVVLSTSRTARFPRVAARNGTVWVVWQDEGEDQTPRRPQIHLRSSVDNGENWGDVVVVSQGAGRAMHPDIDVTPTGLPVVVWQDNATGTLPAPLNLAAFDIMARVVGQDAEPINLSGAGKSVNPAIPLVDTRSARHPASIAPAVAVRGDGLIAVSWQDNRFDSEPGWTGSLLTGEGTDPDDWEILVATRAAGGDWSAPVNASGDASHADWHSTLAFTEEGALVVAWDAKDNSGSSGRDLFIRSARSADDGANFTTPIAVTNVANPGMARRPVFGTTALGTLTLTWSDSRSDDWRWRVYAATVTAGGFGDEQRISGPGNATFQRLERGQLVYTSDRLLERVQRDSRFSVFRTTLR